MSDVLVHTDSNIVSATTAAYGEAKAKVQAIVDLYDTLGLDPLTPLEFDSLFTNTPELIFDKLTGGSVNFGGVPVDKVKAMDIVTKPTGYDNLLSQISQLEKDGRHGFGNHPSRVSFYIATISQIFTLGTGSTVGYSATSQDAIDSAGKYYATTDKQKALYQFAQGVVAAFYAAGLQDMYHDPASNYGNFNPIPEAIADTIDRLDVPNETFIVNVRDLLNGKNALS